MEVMNMFLCVHKCERDDTLPDLSSFTPEGTAGWRRAHGRIGDKQTRTLRIDFVKKQVRGKNV